MQVRIESLVEGAERARGTVIVIDIFRPFSTAAIALGRGAQHLILNSEPAQALALRDFSQ